MRFIVLLLLPTFVQGQDFTGVGNNYGGGFTPDGKGGWIGWAIATARTGVRTGKAAWTVAEKTMAILSRGWPGRPPRWRLCLGQGLAERSGLADRVWEQLR